MSRVVGQVYIYNMHMTNMSNIMIAGNAAAIKVWLVVLSDIAKTVLVETA